MSRAIVVIAPDGDRSTEQRIPLVADGEPVEIIYQPGRAWTVCVSPAHAQILRDPLTTILYVEALPAGLDSLLA